MSTDFIVNHLWQSSCFVFLGALLAFALRSHSPKIRYWVWLSASLKFLIPFALLVSLGNEIPRPAARSVSAADPVFSATIVQMAEPYAPPSGPGIPSRHGMHWMPIAIGTAWALGVLAIALARCRGWWKVREALRAGTPVELQVPVRAVITPSVHEPGVVGFFRPVLVLPAQLLEHLNPRQLSAILTHELCHVRRRDNVFATMHMAVETLFWFHPLVWWVGGRLLEERELACDEEVLRTGCEPSDYVEGILKVCRLYAESSLPCVSGVSGADLKKRLRAILDGTVAVETSRARKAALVTLSLAVLGAPIMIGVITAPVIRAQSPPANTPAFDVASIKSCNEPMNAPAPRSSPGRLATECAELLNLIGNAYTTYADGRLNPISDRAPISGEPSWVRTAAYDINAKAEGTPSVVMMLGPMMQKLLADRFHLQIHRETREGPVYFLTVASGGLKLRQVKDGSCTPWEVPPPPRQPGTQYCLVLFNLLSSSMEARGATLNEFSKSLGGIVGRPVLDKTGITGRFDIHVKFSREGITAPNVRTVGPGPAFVPPPTPDPDTPSIFVALQEELGLRLEAGRGPVDALVIDHIEKPSEN
jgi:uncharacterized protein (TIGR03435 family)